MDARQRLMKAYEKIKYNERVFDLVFHIGMDLADKYRDQSKMQELNKLRGEYENIKV